MMEAARCKYCQMPKGLNRLLHVGQALDRLGAAHGAGAEAAAALAAQEAATAATAATAGAALRASHGELRVLSANGTQLVGKLGMLMRQGQTGSREGLKGKRGRGASWPGTAHRAAKRGSRSFEPG